jgi:nucleoside-diphosphate-sugar epimerase
VQGTGDAGHAILTALLAAGYPLTVLSRTKGKLPADFAKSVKEVEVDYASEASLESALTGIDAVVSTLGNNTLDQQKSLWLAAEKAGVQRFLPSEFGCDLENPITKSLPVFGAKVAFEDWAKQRVDSGESKVTYTVVFVNAFLDWGIEKDFLIGTSECTATLYDGGDYTWSTTRLSTVAQAVISTLQNPEKTRNRAIRVHDGRVSGRQLLEWVRAVSPKQDWTVKEDTTEAAAQKSMNALSKGVMDGWVWLGFLYRGAYSEAAGAGWDQTDNELLGIKTLSEAELKSVVQDAAKKVYASKNVAH